MSKYFLKYTVFVPFQLLAEKKVVQDNAEKMLKAKIEELLG